MLSYASIPSCDTHTSLSLQVLANAGEVGLQPVHVGVRVVALVQDVVQVEVQDVGVQAADLQVVLEEAERSEVRGRALR